MFGFSKKQKQESIAQLKGIAILKNGESVALHKLTYHDEVIAKKCREFFGHGDPCPKEYVACTYYLAKELLDKIALKGEHVIPDYTSTLVKSVE